MTIANRAATAAYLHALNEMSGSKPGELARIASRWAGRAFQAEPSLRGHINQPTSDAMMGIETAIFTALCDANGVDWRLLSA